MSAAFNTVSVGIAATVPLPRIKDLDEASLTEYVHVTPLISMVSAFTASGIAALTTVMSAATALP